MKKQSGKLLNSALEKKLMESLDRRLASRSLSPVAKNRLKMTATSGRSLCELLNKSDPTLFFSRMLLTSPIWLSHARKLTWKLKATPCGHLLFQLAPSVLSIEEIDSGAMPSLLPTPAARDWKDQVSESVAIKQCEKRHSPSIGLLAKAGMLPTLTATDRADKPMPPRNKTTKESGKTMGGQCPPILSVIGEALNPEWCEAYMGFPVGHTSGLPRKERVKQMGNAIYPEIAKILGCIVYADQVGKNAP